MDGVTPIRAKTPKSGQGNQPAAVHNFQMQEEELRDFLINRIADLKQKDDKEEQQEEEVQFKFKASTISNVLPSGHLSE